VLSKTSAQLSEEQAFQGKVFKIVSKGQLISKGLFCVIFLTKKTAKFFKGFLP
jgi:hypothetical protein